MALSARGFLDQCLSTIFPRVCPSCRRRLAETGKGFCSRCLAAFPVVDHPVCLRCGAPLPPGSAALPRLCASCPATPTGTALPVRVRSAARYEGELRKAVLRVKYGGHTSTAASLGLFLAARFPVFFPGETFDVILPVPLHVTRLRERGFNQSVLLARPLARFLGRPLDLSAAVRVRNTPTQSVSSRSERRGNLRGSFLVPSPHSLRKRTVLIIDDVYTTGSTVDSLANELLKAGASTVAAYTLARTAAPATTPEPLDIPLRLL